MTEERIIVVGYKLEVAISIDGEDGKFEKKEIDDIGEIVSDKIVKVKGETQEYFKREVGLLKLILFSTFEWPEERIDKIRVRNIKVKQILPEE